MTMLHFKTNNPCPSQSASIFPFLCSLRHHTSLTILLSKCKSLGKARATALPAIIHLSTATGEALLPFASGRTSLVKLGPMFHAVVAATHPTAVKLMQERGV